MFDFCVYHGGCTDGWTAAWAVHKKLGDIEFFKGKYGATELPNVSGKRVLFVDFSYKQGVLRHLAEHAASITILDHHKTAEADLAPLFTEGLIDGVFDMDRSGAGIAWDYFHGPEDRPLLVDYVEDRDLWRWSLDFSREISGYLSSIPMKDFETWSHIAERMEDRAEFAHMVAQGRAINRKLEIDCEALMKNAQNLAIGGFNVPVVNATMQYASDLANKLATLDDAPFGATYFIDRHGNSVFSLRSLTEKEDVSRVAALYGGGGHRNASGFLLPKGEAL